MLSIQDLTLFSLLAGYFSSSADQSVGGTVSGDAGLPSPAGSNPHPGHMKPFGFVGPHDGTEEMDGFPSTQPFFENYVATSRPLAMRGAAKPSPAFSLWTDEYLLASADGGGAPPLWGLGGGEEEHKILVELAKKENRTGPSKELSFREFLGVYRNEEIYMVDSVPPFLRKDVFIPGPLQCKPIYKSIIVEMILWMSGGGTSSVVHTDSVDNIICVLDGNKTLVLLDPVKYRHKVDLDHPEGAYSGIDVDRVDYNRYPGLADVQFQVVNLSAGDCLYIPYKWIHQVRSYERNVAVNVWWKHHGSVKLALESCPPPLGGKEGATSPPPSPPTLEEVELQGFGSPTEDLDSLKEHVKDYVIREQSVTEFISALSAEIEMEIRTSSDEYTLPLRQIFMLIDKNDDKVVTSKEIERLSDEDWVMVQDQMVRFESIVDEQRVRLDWEQRKTERKADKHRYSETDKRRHSEL